MSAPVLAATASAASPRTQRRTFFGSVRARVVALLAIAAVPAIGASTIVAIDRVDAVQRETAARALLVADVAATRYRLRLEGLRGVLATLANVPAVRDHAEGCSALLADTVARYADWLSNISTFNAEGRLSCSARPAPAGQSFAAAKFFRAAKPDAPFSIGPFQHGDITDSWVFFAAQTMTEGGRFHGVVGAAIRIDNFLRAPDDVPLPPGSVMMLRDSAGTTLIALGPPGVATVPWPETARAGEATLVADTTGVTHRFALVPLDDGIALGVAIRAPTRWEAWGGELAGGLGGALLLLALCFGVVLWGTHQLIIRPIGALRRAVRSWGDIEGDYAPPPQIEQAPIEIRALAEACGRAAHELARRGEHVAALAEQRGVLVKEMHHRVKNSLQIVTSMISLQERRTDSDEARAALHTARDRISALVVLHKHLYAHDDVRRVDMRAYLVDLATMVHDMLDGADRERMRLEVAVPELRLDADRAVPVGLTVVEAMTQAFKHGFADGRGGAVSVRCEADDVEVRIEIADDGGPRAPETEDSRLGTRLIDGFARQLGGRIEIVREGGTTMRLAFPYPEPAPAPSVQPGGGSGV